MNTPIDHQLMAEDNVRFLLLRREPNGRLTYTVKGSPEDIRTDLEEFSHLLGQRSIHRELKLR